MRLEVSLYGDKSAVLGWQQLFEQEKTPYRYAGTEVTSLSSVNVVTGYPEGQIPAKNLASNDQILIVEPQGDYHQTQKTLQHSSIVFDHNITQLPRNASLELLDPRCGPNTAPMLRQLIVESYHRLNKPYVQIWYYSEPKPTVFLLRQDIDYVDIKATRSLGRLSAKHGIHGTYFVNVSGEEEFDEDIGHLTLEHPTTPDRIEPLSRLISGDNEIGNHGYWHWVFPDVQRNKENIRRAYTFLTGRLHTPVKGYASPGAEWNSELQRALEACHMEYSSDGLRDGGFPFFPYVSGKFASTLEVPCYVQCDASFEKPDFPALSGIIQDYFLKLITTNLNTHQPIAILGHPDFHGDRLEEFYAPIFRAINKHHIPSMSMGEYARWWKKRQGMNILCDLADNMLTVTSQNTGFAVSVTTNKGNWLYPMVVSHHTTNTLRVVL
ncbi:MAG: hypothetical protein UY48_C0007G0020 [Candidatus Gottesmanbacteria bacterium GW2011_GWB1_49_7]|uniref:Uncharacterized protein n=1 Tax=Candidatus Gottesmanbacteria bacterium GW2011_GWB1_49_7 TaxID=1618448 RepID=A0A0G1W2F0_9BACT|nr:MAG: hypothetical protein UY48_C0007G0020 [Candidatus Gottesmanbacteria bacterium GW2011_GWB1_49_7]